MEEIEEIKGIKEMIENVCKETFEILTDIYKNSDKKEINTRLILPTKRDKTIRLSEQELRLVFIEQLNQNEYFIDKNLSYSIETPTEFPYTFKDKEWPKKDEGGRSASIDLVINSCNKRVALIEFKALNPAKYDYQKDFCKLIEEENGRDDVARYFIQILETFNKGTRKSIREKLSEENKTYFDKDKINYICYNLNKRDKNNGKRVEQDILNSENND